MTVITQDAVLATFDKLLGTLTLAVAGIAAISLAVAGILVMNVMLVSVTQRTAEIGLLKALGATGTTIRNAFLTEAAMLSLAGALLGYLLGQGGAAADLRAALPDLPGLPARLGVIAGLCDGLVTGIVFRRPACAPRQPGSTRVQALANDGENQNFTAKAQRRKEHQK